MFDFFQRKFRSAFGGLPPVYWYLWTGMLVTRLGGLVIPFLALYLTQERKVPIQLAGLLVSLFGLGSVCAAPIGGFLADRLGRRTTLLVSLFCAAAMMLALSFARGVPVIAVATFSLGFCTDLSRPVVAALVADVVPAEDRLRAYSVLYWAVNIGFSVAPVVGGLLARHSFRFLFLGDAATTLIYACIVVGKVPETRPSRSAPAEPHAAPERSPYRDPVLLSFCALMFLFGVVFLQFLSSLPIDMAAKGIGPGEYGAIIATNGILIVLAQPFVAEFLKGRSRARTLAAAAVLVGVGFGGSGLCRTPLAYVGCILIWTLGELLQAPVTSAVVADLAPTHSRGLYQGVYFGSWSLAQMVAPAAGTWVLARLGSGTLWMGCWVVCFAVALGHLAIGPARRARMALLGHTERSSLS